jgi:hypothetical protein
MRKLLILLTLVAIVTGSATSALAVPSGLYFHLGLIGYQSKFDNSAPAVQERTVLAADTGLGIIVGDWAYIGGVFNYSPVNETVGGVGHNETYQYYGPAFGWMGDEWIVVGQYLAYAEQRDSAPWGTTVRTGSGYALSVGYRWELGTFGLGPMVTYKSLRYTNCKDPYSGATSTCDPAINHSETTPYVTVWWNFK